MIHDEKGRFEAEIYQVCASARFGEGRYKSERESSQAGYLPFMSTASLPVSITTAASEPSRSTQPNEQIGSSALSLKLLHQALCAIHRFLKPINPYRDFLSNPKSFRFSLFHSWQILVGVETTSDGSQWQHLRLPHNRGALPLNR
jgi:hypothetical protein